MKMTFRKWLAVAAAATIAVAMTACGNGAGGNNLPPWWESHSGPILWRSGPGVDPHPDSPATTPGTPPPAANIGVFTWDATAGELIISNRRTDFTGLDIWFANLVRQNFLTAGGTYTVRVQGRVGEYEGANPGQIMVQALPNFNWGTTTPLSATEPFDISRQFTLAGNAPSAAGGAAGPWDRARITTDGAGVGTDLIITNIEISNAAGVRWSWLQSLGDLFEIEVELSGLTGADTLDFVPLQVGYEAADLTPATVTITNTGALATGVLTIDIDNANFVIAGSPIENIESGAYGTFTVTPALGLELPSGAGYYTFTSTITVRGTGIEESFTASFIVTYDEPIGPDTITLTPATASVRAGGTQQFTHTVSPEGTIAAVNWLVDGPTNVNLHGTSIVNGLLTIDGDVPSGTQLTVRATAIAPNPAQAFATGTATVTVTYAIPTGVTISPASAAAGIGGVATFTATVAPAGASQAVTWTVDGTATAANSEGGLTFTVPGTASLGDTFSIVATTVADGAAETPIASTPATLTVAAALGNFITLSTELGTPTWLNTAITSGAFAATPPLRVSGNPGLNWVVDGGNVSLDLHTRAQPWYGIDIDVGAATLNLPDLATHLHTIIFTGTVSSPPADAAMVVQAPGGTSAGQVVSNVTGSTFTVTKSLPADPFATIRISTNTAAAAMPFAITGITVTRGDVRPTAIEVFRLSARMAQAISDAGTENTATFGWLNPPIGQSGGSTFTLVQEAPHAVDVTNRTGNYNAIEIRTGAVTGVEGGGIGIDPAAYIYSVRVIGNVIGTAPSTGQMLVQPGEAWFAAGAHNLPATENAAFDFTVPELSAAFAASDIRIGTNNAPNMSFRITEVIVTRTGPR